MSSVKVIGGKANDVNGVSSVDGLMDDVHFYNRPLAGRSLHQT